jgi:AraC family transcriptional regulator, arabinose operon regulatory protein
MASTRRARQEPPFEDVLHNWTEWSRPFGDIIFAPMSLQDRRRWMASTELADFRVFSCGYYVAAAGLNVHRKSLGEGIYIYNVAGRGFFRQNDRTWPVGPGELLYCPPRVEHEYWSDPQDPWSIHWMHVSGPTIRSYARAIGFSTDSPVIQIGVQSEIVYLFNMLYDLAKPCFERRRAAAIRACAQLILTRIALTPRSAAGSYEQVRDVRHIQEYMRRMVDRRLGLNDFAARFDASPAHFSRVFKRHANFAPIEYFLRLKVHKACCLLATTKRSVKEIARQLSFDDQNYFSRLFKRIVGMSPKAYRRGVWGSGTTAVALDRAGESLE